MHSIPSHFINAHLLLKQCFMAPPNSRCYSKRLEQVLVIDTVSNIERRRNGRTILRWIPEQVTAKEKELWEKLRDVSSFEPRA